MDPATAATIVTVGKTALKGAKWGYGKYKKSREGKRCVLQILEDASRLSPEEERILRCAAKKLCGGRAANMKEAKASCRGGSR